MNTSAVALTLLICLVLTGLVNSFVWGIIGFALKIAPRAAHCFVLGNAVLALGTLLLVLREGRDETPIYAAANLFLLAGLCLMRTGLLRLLHLPVAHKEHALLTAGVALLFLVGVDGQSLARLMLVSSLVAAWLGGRIVRDCLRGLRAEFGGLTTLLIALPFALLALLMLARVLRLGLLMHPALIGGDTLAGSYAVPLMWALVALMVMSNISLLGATLGRLIARVRQLAEHDALTGLWNRRALEARIADERVRRGRGGPPFSLAVCDLDHFKRINDTLGHAAGDAALRHVAATLRMAARDLDVVGRFGGEEFLIVMPMTDLGGARDAAERLRARLAESPWSWQGQRVPLTASLGVAQADELGDDALFRRADAALYRAKARGRNRVELADAEAPALSGERAAPGLAGSAGAMP